MVPDDDIAISPPSHYSIGDNTDDDHFLHVDWNMETRDHDHTTGQLEEIDHISSCHEVIEPLQDNEGDELDYTNLVMSPASCNSGIENASCTESSNSSDEDFKESITHTTAPISPDAGAWPLSGSGTAPNIMASYMSSSSFWFVRIILLVVGFLYTQHHLSFRACGILLWCLRSMLMLLGAIDFDNHMPTTLGTALIHLGIVDHFTLAVVCPKC
jgi:hypothetical protein